MAEAESVETAPSLEAMPAVMGVEETTSVDDSTVRKRFITQIEESKTYRKQFHGEWRTNVELRIGRPMTVYTGLAVPNPDIAEIRTELNPDWSLTKTKTANLYSQDPKVIGTHENKDYAPAVAPFMKALNYELGDKRAHIGTAMEEVLNDVVNAAGVGAIIMGYAARTETVQVPAPMPAQPPMPGQPPAPNQPPMPSPTQGTPPSQPPAAPAQPQGLMGRMLSMIGLGGQSSQPPQQQMIEHTRVVSDKFYATRVSPRDLLWPKAFIGSDFNDADWVGRTGRTSWAVAKNEFQLDDSQKQDVLGAAQRKTDESLRVNTDVDRQDDLDQVEFDEIYYWRYKVDPDEKHFTRIWKLIVIRGLDEDHLTDKQKQLLHGEWKGQQYDEQAGTYVGPCKFPIQILTLTYITDNSVPPSDSAAGRPQVNDLRRSRAQMFSNRDRSMPLRWVDVNRVDPVILYQLMRGVYQGMIPSLGDGTRMIGEVARASYPAEDFSFDAAAKADLLESWRIGPNQIGTQDTSDQTAAAAKITQGNFATGMSQERAKVAKFFLNCVEVIAGLMALFSEFPSLSKQERQQMEQAWDRKHILHDLVLKILPDSAIRMESGARIQQLMQFLNMTVKSGFVNPQPIIAEITELNGLNPAEVMVQPKPPEPEKPGISYRFSSKDDVNNPMVLAILLGNGQPPTPDTIQQAQKLLAMSQTAPQPEPQPVPGMPGQPGQPQPGGPPVGPGVPEEAHPNWQLASKVAARSRDM